MTRIDDRTPEQHKTHNWLITATDRFMSGWGGARGGASKCAWACTPEHASHVLDWVRSRGEMKYVNSTNGRWYPRAAHVHIYVVDDEHPALEAFYREKEEEYTRKTRRRMAEIERDQETANATT